MNISSQSSTCWSGSLLKAFLPVFALLLLCLHGAAHSSLLLAATSEPANKRQVVFLPFSIEIPGSYTYLRNGLTSVLSSRLATRANIIALPQSATTDQMAAALKSGNYASFNQLLQQTGADYLFLGSLAAKGDQFEVTGHVFSKVAGQTPKKFTQAMRSVDDAMTAIDAMAWDISGSVFGKPKPEEIAATTSPSSGSAAFQTAHPERAYRENLMSGSATGLEAGGKFEIVTTQRSKGIALDLMDIDAGDLNGDGTSEIVLLTSSELLVYRLTDNQYQKIAAASIPGHLRYHCLSLADLNKNGRLEMYISGSNGDTPTSLALEWDGRQFAKLFDHVGYYLKAFNPAKGTALLLGQASQTTSGGKDGIYQMNLDSGKGVTVGKQMALPRELKLFNIAMGDINGDNRQEVVAINNRNHLQVYDDAGALLWSSSDQFGASSNYYGSIAAQSDEVKDTTFISTRIILDDLDKDGAKDIVVGKNRLQTVPLMPNLRYFEGSSIAALKWTQGALAPMWETKKIANYTVNYQVLHPDQDSKQIQLIFADTENSFPFVFWKSSSFYINTHTLKPAQP